MKLFILPLMAISVLLSFSASPMKRNFFKKNVKVLVNSAIKEESLAAFFPGDVIRTILCIHQVARPWQEIVRIYKLRTVNKSWYAALIDVDTIRQMLNIPRLHFAAGIGDSEKIMEYKLAGDSILEPDQWEFGPAHYAVGNGLLESCEVLGMGNGFHHRLWEEDGRLKLSDYAPDNVIEGFCMPDDFTLYDSLNLMQAIQDDDVEQVQEILFFEKNVATCTHFQQALELKNDAIILLLRYCLQGQYEKELFDKINWRTNGDDKFFEGFNLVGANPNAFDADGATFLHKVSKQNTLLPTLEQLLKCKGVDIHIHDKNIRHYKQHGNTPIHNAALFGADECLKALLNVDGCDIDILDAGDFGQNPLSDAIHGGYATCVDLLLEKGANSSSKNKKDCETPLHAAARWNRVDALIGLLNSGQCSIDIRDDQGMTPLHKAVKAGSVRCVNILINRGASINATTKLGDTPLHLACQYGRPKCMRLLIGVRGCDLNAENNDGDRPLHKLAQKKGSIQDMELLIAAGAAICAINKSGMTARDLAREAVRCIDIVTYLNSKEAMAI